MIYFWWYLNYTAKTEKNQLFFVKKALRRLAFLTFAIG